jgi:flagellar hook-length control protein FliK
MPGRSGPPAPAKNGPVASPSNSVAQFRAADVPNVPQVAGTQTGTQVTMAAGAVAAMGGTSPVTSSGALSNAHAGWGPEATPTAEGAQPESVAAQLATVLSPAARQADGSYQVTIHLQPEDLGAVRVDLHLEAGTVNVSLHAEGDATRDMLRQNLGQLRQQLADSGLSTGQFDVSGGTGGGGTPSGQQQAGGAVEEPGAEGPNSVEAGTGAGTAAVPVSPNGQLDMRL